MNGDLRFRFFHGTMTDGPKKSSHNDEKQNSLFGNPAPTLPCTSTPPRAGSAQISPPGLTCDVLPDAWLMKRDGAGGHCWAHRRSAEVRALIT